MQYVICYDRSDDRRRSRIASALLDFGKRVQERLFVAHMDDDSAARMLERVRHVVDLDWDKVPVFQLCGACEGRTIVIGQGELVHDPEWYVV